jgi:hypothetical protein
VRVPRRCAVGVAGGAEDRARGRPAAPKTKPSRSQHRFWHYCGDGCAFGAHEELQRCSAIVVENLDFADARATGRETLGRGQRGKRLRRTTAGILTRLFRARLTARAARRRGDRGGRGLHQQMGQPALDHTVAATDFRAGFVTRHHGAAAAIGRRGLGLAIRRRPAGPRNGQRTAAGTPPPRLLNPFSYEYACGRADLVPSPV